MTAGISQLSIAILAAPDVSEAAFPGSGLSAPTVHDSSMRSADCRVVRHREAGPALPSRCPSRPAHRIRCRLAASGAQAAKPFRGPLSPRSCRVPYAPRTRSSSPFRRCAVHPSGHPRAVPSPSQHLPWQQLWPAPRARRGSCGLFCQLSEIGRCHGAPVRIVGCLGGCLPEPATEAEDRRACPRRISRSSAAP